ncbi:MAG: DUF2341 domain-containing protein, partial [Lutibacter sp.]
MNKNRFFLFGFLMLFCFAVVPSVFAWDVFLVDNSGYGAVLSAPCFSCSQTYRVCNDNLISSKSLSAGNLAFNVYDSKVFAVKDSVPLQFSMLKNRVDLVEFSEFVGYKEFCSNVSGKESLNESKELNKSISSCYNESVYKNVLKNISVDYWEKSDIKDLTITLEKSKCVDIKVEGNIKLGEAKDVVLQLDDLEYKSWAWWNASFNSSQVIILSNVSANISVYQYNLVIPKSANMNSNFSDLRFLTPDNSTELSYKMQEYNSTHAIVSLNLSIFNGTVAYMYYGNPSAISQSSNAADPTSAHLKTNACTSVGTCTFTGDLGMKIFSIYNQKILNIEKFPNTLGGNNATNCLIYASDFTTLLYNGTITINDNCPVDYNLAAGTSYYVTFVRYGSSWVFADRSPGGLPVINTYINWTAGRYRAGTDDNRLLGVKSVRTQLLPIPTLTFG